MNVGGAAPGTNPEPDRFEVDRSLVTVVAGHGQSRALGAFGRGSELDLDRALPLGGMVTLLPPLVIENDPVSPDSVGAATTRSLDPMFETVKDWLTGRVELLRTVVVAQRRDDNFGRGRAGPIQDDTERPLVRIVARQASDWLTWYRQTWARSALQCCVSHCWQV